MVKLCKMAPNVETFFLTIFRQNFEISQAKIMNIEIYAKWRPTLIWNQNLENIYFFHFSNFQISHQGKKIENFEKNLAPYLWKSNITNLCDM